MNRTISSRLSACWLPVPRAACQPALLVRALGTRGDKQPVAPSLPHRVTSLSCLAACWLLLATPAIAQNYSFGVPDVEMNVVVNPDASLRIIYDITFNNSPVGRTIDIVDIGTPTPAYDLSNVEATCDGQPAARVLRSEVVSPGFEVHLGAGAIRPGKKGTVHVEFTMPDLVFQDTTREDYASLRITPTWFDPKFVRGSTHLKIAIHLPESVKPEEALHQGENFTNKAVFKDRTVVAWEWPATRFTEKHLVAVSFPKRDMDRVVKMTALGLLLKWFEESTQARVIAAIVLLVLLGVLFFRFTGGTGVVVYVVVSAVAVWVCVISPGWHLALLPIVGVLIGVNEWALRRRAARYMPPIAQVEGGGIKRGLTAPEAACLLELPLGRVLGLVVFGMLKKGILHQLTADPLCVSVDEAFQLKGDEAGDVKQRDRLLRKAAREKGVIVHRYEYPFIYLLSNNEGKPVDKIDFRVPMRKLVERVVARMKGFDVSDTQDYYRSIVRRATRQAAAIGDVRQREATVDRTFEWILVDDNWPTVFSGGWTYRPPWSRRTVVTTGGSWGGGGTSAAPEPSIPGQTSLGDVAGSFAGWTENTFGSFASTLSPGSLSVAKPTGGFLDLGGADRLTGEFFQALSEASSSGGGGGGGCACACAGCACACACAGGGR